MSPILKFERLKEIHLEEIAKIAKEAYDDECLAIKALPKNYGIDTFTNLLKPMMRSHLGVVAIDGNQVVGYLACYGPIDNLFGYSKGVFSPIHGNGTVKDNREQIYTRLYEYAANKWVNEGIYTHGIALYAHDHVGVNTLFENGFGMRCVDAVTSLELTTSEGEHDPEVVMHEVDYKDIACIYDFKRDLIKHMHKSPIFMPLKPFNEEKYLNDAKKTNTRIFTMQINEKVIGYIEICTEGENFTCDNKTTMNICGAYMYPEYRGKGRYEQLLTYMLNTLKKENYKSCGVDFESINPNANRFWRKHFTPYTYSLVRRVDERINS